MDRRGRINIVGIVLFLAVAAAGLGAWLFVPYYWDYQVMKEVTKATAHEWHGLGEQKARDKLPNLLHKRGLDSYITERECTFEDRGPIKSIDCAWQVDVYYPFTKYFKRLSFHIVTQVNEGGDVDQY